MAKKKRKQPNTTSYSTRFNNEERAMIDKASEIMDTSSSKIIRDGALIHATKIIDLLDGINIYEKLGLTNTGVSND